MRWRTVRASWQRGGESVNRPDRRLRSLWVMGAALGLLAVTLGGCGDDDGASTASTLAATTAAPTTTSVTTTTTTTTAESTTTTTAAPGMESVSLTPAAIERAAEVERVVREWWAAWESNNLEALAATLADEFVFNEPLTVNAFKEEYLAKMEPFITNPNWDSGEVNLRFLVGSDEFIQSYQTWGFGGATEESPLVEVDLFVVRNGKITSIVSMYGADILQRYGEPVPIELMDAYVAAWSSGDPAQVEALYAETAVRGEALYGVELQGSTEIARYATGFFQRHGDAVLTIIEPFVFGRGDDTWEPNIGAVFSLVNAAGCSVEFAVLLEGDASGAITSERVYYNLNTIQTCDWQR
jgi:ketosteroid isomerase-like protein